MLQILGERLKTPTPGLHLRIPQGGACTRVFSNVQPGSNTTILGGPKFDTLRQFCFKCFSYRLVVFNSACTLGLTGIL